MRVSGLKAQGLGLDLGRTSQAMGTVELTGLEMIVRMAFGHASAQAATRLRTMEPLVLKRSSRVMPGLRGTPAGITTTCKQHRTPHTTHHTRVRVRQHRQARLHLTLGVWKRQTVCLFCPLCLLICRLPVITLGPIRQSASSTSQTQPSTGVHRFHPASRNKPAASLHPTPYILHPMPRPVAQEVRGALVPHAPTLV
jgi:hypothetical protein